jgi:chorismate mutase
VPDDTDPVIQQFRDKISDNDRALVEAVNARLRLVAQLKAYGVGAIDCPGPVREERILRDLPGRIGARCRETGCARSTRRSSRSRSARWHVTLDAPVCGLPLSQ